MADVGGTSLLFQR